MLIGYARCSTDAQDLTAQDLTAQRDALTALGVQPDRIYVDHGLTGTSRARPGLREALAACRDGDTLVVTKLDRLADMTAGLEMISPSSRLALREVPEKFSDPMKIFAWAVR